jgi:hypothetical protein
MGPLFVLLFWLIIAGIFGTFWLVGLIIFIIGKRKNSKLMMWFGGTPVVFLTAIAVAGVGLVGYGMIRATNPRYVFKDTFGEPPSKDVTEIKSKVYGFADEAQVFLTFKAEPETVHRIILKDLAKITYQQYEREMPGTNINPPRWWRRPTISTSDIYFSSPNFGDGKRFASETTLLTYDENSRTVMYFYIGID